MRSFDIKRYLAALVMALVATGAAAQPVQVSDLANTRFQWTVPAAEVTSIGYFDYWIDVQPFADAAITRVADQTINGITHAVWQAKLPTTLADGNHEVMVRACRTGATNAETDCSFGWLKVAFEVRKGVPLPPRPPTPSNGTFITVTVTVTPPVP
jgi:hypothetical protein